MARTFGGVNGYGYTKDPNGHMVTGAHVLLGGANSNPNSASIRDFVPCIFDQTTTSSCTGQATGGAIDTRMKVKGTVIPLVSRSGIYKLGRMIDRSPDTNGNLPSLQDDGAMPNQIMRGITEWGVISESVDPFDPNTINNDLDFGELETASGCELTGYYRIDVTGSRRIDYLKAAIVAGFPVCFGIQVDNVFENYNGNGVIGAPDPNDILGGHYLYMVEYTTLSSGLIVITFTNSWNTSWGDAGYGHADENFITGMQDIYIMDVSQETELKKAA